MNYAEFVGKLTLINHFIVGTLKKMPYDVVVGIPCGDNNFFPLYHISQEYFHHIDDFQNIYNYIHALVNKDKKILSQELNILNKLNLEVA